MTATPSDDKFLSYEQRRYAEDITQVLERIEDSLLRLEHILALDFVARFGTEHEARYAREHLLGEFRAQAREVINGHE